MLVEVQSASHVSKDQLPRRLRVTAFSKTKILIGDTVSFSASLMPLPRPVEPGGFDYGRMLYFWSVGGTAHVKGEVTTHEAPISWRYELRRQFHALRSLMGERITSVIPGPLGAFANALITGERAAIPDSMNASLQISGLYHILSIFRWCVLGGAGLAGADSGLCLAPSDQEICRLRGAVCWPDLYATGGFWCCHRAQLHHDCCHVLCHIGG
jgi:competence protein ComEC